METSNVFKGKFKVVSFYCNVADQGWVCFKRYGNNSFLWNFIETKVLNFPSGEVAYEGKLREHFRKVTDLTEYSYYPKDRELYIDRSDYCDDGFMWACINDRYRVERINDTEYWLYDLEDIENEPKDYRFKLKVRRIE